MAHLIPKFMKFTKKNGPPETKTQEPGHTPSHKKFMLTPEVLKMRDLLAKSHLEIKKAEYNYKIEEGLKGKNLSKAELDQRQKEKVRIIRMRKEYKENYEKFEESVNKLIEETVKFDESGKKINISDIEEIKDIQKINNAIGTPQKADFKKYVKEHRKSKEKLFEEKKGFNAQTRLLEQQDLVNYKLKQIQKLQNKTKKIETKKAEAKKQLNELKTKKKENMKKPKSFFGTIKAAFAIGTKVGISNKITNLEQKIKKYNNKLTKYKKIEGSNANKISENFLSGVSAGHEQLELQKSLEEQTRGEKKQERKNQQKKVNEDIQVLSNNLELNNLEIKNHNLAKENEIKKAKAKYPPGDKLNKKINEIEEKYKKIIDSYNIIITEIENKIQKLKELKFVKPPNPPKPKKKGPEPQPNPNQLGQPGQQGQPGQ